MFAFNKKVERVIIINNSHVFKQQNNLFACILVLKAWIAAKYDAMCEVLMNFAPAMIKAIETLMGVIFELKNVVAVDNCKFIF